MGSGQQRHDILMKFYNLMRGHEDDLARIIVSPCVFIVKACSHPTADPREWQDLGRSEGGYQRMLRDYTTCNSNY